MQLKIEKLIYGGDGLARLPADERGPGKTVFVPFVLDGETAEASLSEQKPGFARGRLERLLESSAQRAEPACPYFRSCGGCHYQHSKYEHQLAIKAAILRETVKRTAKIEIPCEVQIHPSPPWNYRNRARLKVQTSPEFALGYYKFRSHELLPVEQCPISSPLINRAIEGAWLGGRAGEIPESVREIEFFADHADQALVLEVYCMPGLSATDAAEVAKKLKQNAAEIKGVSIFEQPRFQQSSFERSRFEQSRVNEASEPRQIAAIGDTEMRYQTKLSSYRVSAGSFFQVNRFLVDELVQIVTSGESGTLALDLYAGVGLFSMVLVRSFPQIIAVESSQTSYSDLRHNSGPEVKAVRAPTDQYLGQASGIRPDLVVADPPRGGLGENVVRSVATLESPRITYVSCDPSTLARDLRTFVSLGYRIDGVHLIDLFPQTYHIESVFHLAR
jgi:23S rRNA (uracil1939-C5)-methyltransferase